MENKTHTVKCPNCNEKHKVSQENFNGTDEYYIDCMNCNYPIAIEIEYDDNDNIINLYTY